MCGIFMTFLKNTEENSRNNIDGENRNTKDIGSGKCGDIGDRLYCRDGGGLWMFVCMLLFSCGQYEETGIVNTEQSETNLSGWS